MTTEREPFGDEECDALMHEVGFMSTQHRRALIRAAAKRAYETLREELLASIMLDSSLRGPVVERVDKHLKRLALAAGLERKEEA